MAKKTIKKVKYIGTRDGQLFRVEGSRTCWLMNGMWEDYRGKVEDRDFDPVEIRTESKEEIRMFALQRAVQALEEYKCEFKPSSFNSRNPFYEKGNEEAEFISEGFLYPLLGKEDARSVLSRVQRIKSALEFQ